MSRFVFQKARRSSTARLNLYEQDQAMCRVVHGVEDGFGIEAETGKDYEAFHARSEEKLGMKIAVFIDSCTMLSRCCDSAGLESVEVRGKAIVRISWQRNEVHVYLQKVSARSACSCLFLTLTFQRQELFRA